MIGLDRLRHGEDNNVKFLFLFFCKKFEQYNLGHQMTDRTEWTQKTTRTQPMEIAAERAPWAMKTTERNDYKAYS